MLIYSSLVPYFRAVMSLLARTTWDEEDMLNSDTLGQTKIIINTFLMQQYLKQIELKMN